MSEGCVLGVLSSNSCRSWWGWGASYLQVVTDTVTEGVQAVTETMTETVQVVSDTVAESVQAVSETVESVCRLASLYI